jgi:hypothetical protein
MFLICLHRRRCFCTSSQVVHPLTLRWRASSLTSASSSPSMYFARTSCAIGSIARSSSRLHLLMSSDYWVGDS